MKKMTWTLLLTALLIQCGVAENKRVIRGFADSQFTASDAEGENSAFSLGQFDSYSTGNLGESVSYLTELVVEYDEGWIIDLERLWVRYYVSDGLKFSFGKFHTPLGYWNRAYHHGSLLHTSIDRPLFLLFEDEGGILPIHSTGVLFSGSNLTPANISYDVMIGNGLGASPMEDNDSHKSLSAYIHSKAIDGVDFGVSLYTDKISEGAETDAHGVGNPLTEDIDQLILGVSLALEIGDIEVLTEVVSARNDSDTGSSTAKGFYFLGSYTMGRFHPFVKFDLLQIDDDDIYYQPTDLTVTSGGIKLDVNFLAAVKLQYSLINDNNGENVNKVAAQFSIGF